VAERVGEGEDGEPIGAGDALEIGLRDHLLAGDEVAEIHAVAPGPRLRRRRQFVDEVVERGKGQAGAGAAAGSGAALEAARPTSSRDEARTSTNHRNGGGRSGGRDFHKPSRRVKPELFPRSRGAAGEGAALQRCGISVRRACEMPTGVIAL
jgi:hypothetical protein